jgi:ethanolamine permease
LTLLVTACAVLFCTCAGSPGIIELQGVAFPLNPGYQRALNIGSKAATALALPATFATSFGFAYGYGHQCCAMAKSGLFPPFLARLYGENQTPYMSLIICSAVSFSVMFFIQYVYPEFLAEIFNVCMLGSFIVYEVILLSYVVFRLRYSRLERNFVNPLGYFGVVSAAFIWLIGIVSIAFLQKDYSALIAFGAYTCMMSVYYFFVAKHRQFFSREEQNVLMVAYVINGEHSSWHSTTNYLIVHLFVYSFI